jgi:uncharacterized protein (DUF924 family)
LYFCLINFRVISSAAMRAHLRLMKWLAQWRLMLSAAALIKQWAMRPLFYLPFMHSEALVDQDRCVHLYEPLGDSEQLRYATSHRDVIRRFGRFPGRNCALGRETTATVRKFLKSNGVGA